MKFNAAIPEHGRRAAVYFFELVKGKKFFEMKEIRPIRTNQQNRYLHLLFKWFAIEYGERQEYVKQVIFKQWVNSQYFRTEFINRKTGEVREEWRSTRDLDTGELTQCIERFREWSSQEASIYLPQANEDEFLKHIEIEAEKHKNYL